MPRRSPPSSLRLTTGPIPPRRQVSYSRRREKTDMSDSAPKHRMPSVPLAAVFRTGGEGHGRQIVEGRRVDVDRLLQPLSRAMIVLRG